MIRFSRFERKILMAMSAVALVPLIGALVLGQTALREAYQVGVNQRVRQQLEHSLTVYQQYFTLLRDAADHAADAIASDHTLRAAVEAGEAQQLERTLATVLGQHANVARIMVKREGRTLASAELGARLDADTMRLLSLERRLADSNATLTITVSTPATAFREHQRAGELVEVFSRLEAGTRFVSNFYLLVYIGFLLSVIVLALAVGIVMSRRVTSRIALLVDATSKVGAGNLTVQVPSTVDDEVGDLTQAFNRMVRDIRESRERIEYLQQISAWQQFARRLAHEIKNPLTPIQLAMQEVHRSYQGNDPAYQRRLADAAAIVQEEVATLRRLVGEFSEFARLPEVHVANADLNHFVRDAERSLLALQEELGAASAKAAPIEVRIQVDEHALPVQIDAMMLRRCVDNLVRNAMQAIRQHRTDHNGHVEIRTRLQENRAVLEVSDDGPGVPHDDQARVFDPYFTTKAEGTGLGLAIVKKVVIEHGGEVRCRDGHLGGATFEIRLPLRN